MKRTPQAQHGNWSSDMGPPVASALMMLLHGQPPHHNRGPQGALRGITGSNLFRYALSAHCTLGSKKQQLPHSHTQVQSYRARLLQCSLPTGATTADLEVYCIVVEDLSTQNLRFGLLHQQPFVLLPLGRQIPLLHLLRHCTTPRNEHKVDFARRSSL